MVASYPLLLFVRNFHQTPGVTEGVEKLATSGPLGLALVVVTAALIWTIKKLLDTKDEQKNDAINNTDKMLNLSDKTASVVSKIEVMINTNNERLRTNDELNKELIEVLNENKEILRTLKEQRMRR